MRNANAVGACLQEVQVFLVKEAVALLTEWRKSQNLSLFPWEYPIGSNEKQDR